jgi:hypothetical protein
VPPREEMRLLRTIVITCVAVALSVSWVMAQATPYALSDWACGVIVWPGEVPDYADDFAQRLTEAVTTAFGFWGYDNPTTILESFDEDSAFRIYDPAIQAERIIPPLRWEDRETIPVVVIAFPGERELISAMGDTELYAAFYSTWPLSPSQQPDAESWIWSVGAGCRNMVCASSAEDGVLIHEFAHWFTFQWCYSRGVAAPHLPNYILEGMAEATCAVVEDANRAIIDRLRAHSWAQNNCLTGSIQGIMKYSVGENLVGYLIETLGCEGFLATLSDWSMRAWFMIDSYQGNWRESLDLPALCPLAEAQHHEG